MKLDDFFIRGPVRYYEGRFILNDRTIYFFADVHVAQARCPSSQPVLSFSSFLQKICRWNPDKTFHLLMEVPGHMDLVIAPDRRDLFISQVYQQVFKKTEPNLVAHGIDVRYPGIKRALTILNKTNTILRHMVEFHSVDPTEKEKLLQMLPRLVEFFEDIDVGAYIDLFLRAGKLSIDPIFQESVPFLETTMKKELYRYEIEPSFIEIVKTLLTRTPNEDLPTKPLLAIFYNKVQMIGVLLTDTAALLRLFSIAPQEETIVFAGLDHIRNMIEFLQRLNFYIAEEVLERERDHFQCLPVKDIMRDLRKN